MELRLLKVCVVVARWVKVTVAVGEETDGGVEQQKLTTDSEVVSLDQPGQVTG